MKYTPGNEIEAAKDIKQTIGEERVLAGIVMLMLGYLMLAHSLSVTILEHLAIISLPLLNFSWGLMKHLSSASTIIFLSVVLVVTLLHRRSLLVPVVAFLLVYLMEQLEPDFEMDEYHQNFLTLKFMTQMNAYKRFLMFLKVAVFLFMAFRTLRKSNSTLANKVAQMCLAVVLLTEEMMRVFNVYKYGLRLAIVVAVIASCIATKNKNQRDRILYGYFLLAIFAGPSGYVLLFLQLTLQTSLIDKLEKDSFLPIILAMLAEVAWLAQGIRPNFSSLDIRNSYVFSREFSLLLNGGSMWLYLMATNLLAILPTLAVEK